MESFRSQPRPVKIVAGGALAAILLVLVFFAAFGGSSTTVVAEGTNIREIEAAQWKLKRSGIKAQLTKDGSTYRLIVPEDSASKADMSLGGTLGKADVKAKGECVAPSALAGNKQQAQYEECTDRLTAETFLLKAPGVQQASATVETVEADTLTGASKKIVGAQIFKETPEAQLDAAALATGLAAMVGAQPEDVTIHDADTNTVLFRGGDGSIVSSSAGGSSCGAPPADDVVDVSRKEAYIVCTMQEKLESQIANLVGGAGRAKVTVGVTLNAEARTTSVNEILPGVITSQSRQTGDGAVNDDKQYTPGSKRVETQAAAGAIKQLRLAATVDSQHVTPAMERAVREHLKAMVDQGRGDPVPTVTSVKFSAAAEPQTGDTGTGSPADGTQPGGAVTEVTGKVPGPVMAIAFILLIGLITAIALLWRRGARLAAERRQFEDEFRHEQQLFANFANQNPDDVARQLEQWIGQPAGREPTPLR